MEDLDFVVYGKKSDMHIHSPWSDGLKALDDCLIEAESQKVKRMAITDHDSIGAHFELRDRKLDDLYSGEIVSGVELSVAHLGFRIEILGYDFDIDKMAKYKILNVVKKQKRFQKLLNTLVCKCKKLGFVITGKPRVDRKYPLVADALIKAIKEHPQNAELLAKYDLENKLFSRIMNDKDFILYQDPAKSLPTITEACNYIHKCGGKTVLPHPYKNKVYDNLTPMEMVESVYALGILNGIEIAHSCNTIEEILELNDFCLKNKLIRTFGSDYHGNDIWEGYKCHIGMLTESGLKHATVLKAIKQVDLTDSNK